MFGVFLSFLITAQQDLLCLRQNSIDLSLGLYCPQKKKKGGGGWKPKKPLCPHIVSLLVLQRVRIMAAYTCINRQKCL